MRSPSSGAIRRPSRQAAERTPAMSAPVARTAVRSSARRAPASAISSRAGGPPATPPAGVPLGYQRCGRVVREPFEEPATVLYGGVEQAAAYARAARGRDDRLWRQGPAPTSLGGGHTGREAPCA